MPLVRRITHTDPLRSFDEPGDEVLVNRILDVDPRSRVADLPAVRVDQKERAVDRLLEVRVGEHEGRRLASQLEGHTLEGVCSAS